MKPRDKRNLHSLLRKYVRGSSWIPWDREQPGLSRFWIFARPGGAVRAGRLSFLRAQEIQAGPNYGPQKTSSRAVWRRHPIAQLARPRANNTSAGIRRQIRG